MANLPETSNFDSGIYQIEINDFVLGGVNGISNLQAKALANRTKWLKEHSPDKDTVNTFSEENIFQNGVRLGKITIPEFTSIPIARNTELPIGYVVCSAGVLNVVDIFDASVSSLATNCSMFEYSQIPPNQFIFQTVLHLRKQGTGTCSFQNQKIKLYFDDIAPPSYGSPFVTIDLPDFTFGSSALSTQSVNYTSALINMPPIDVKVIKMTYEFIPTVANAFDFNYNAGSYGRITVKYPEVILSGKELLAFFGKR